MTHGGLFLCGQPAGLCPADAMTDARRPLDLSVTFGAGRKGDPLRLRNPVIAAAGTFGPAGEAQRDLDITAIGAFVTPALTRRTRSRGGPAPLRETPAGLLLAAPYPSLSYRTALRRHAAAWEASPVPVIANLPADDADECLEVASALADHGGIAAVELALSAQALRGGSAAAVQRLCEQLLSVWPASLLIKLPYGTDDLLGSIEAAAAGGADAVTLGGGFPGRAAGHGTADGLSRLVSGRVVGPATRPLALHVVATVCAATRVPVIASGGITCAEDALDFLLAGAQAVQVGSASLRDPAAVADVAGDLEALLRATGAVSVAALRDRRRGEGSPLYPSE